MKDVFYFQYHLFPIVFTYEIHKSDQSMCFTNPLSVICVSLRAINWHMPRIDHLFTNT